MKKEPKKVFILENGSYREITYAQFCQNRDADETYKDKHWFIRLHGILMEVRETDYKVFYKERRRQKYLKERSMENNDISIDMFEDNGGGIQSHFFKEKDNIPSQVESKLMYEALYEALSILPDDEEALIRKLFFEELTERNAAEKYGVSQAAINKRKARILKKLKKILEN